jgi:hypothetical protein
VGQRLDRTPKKRIGERGGKQGWGVAWRPVRVTVPLRDECVPEAPLPWAPALRGQLTPFECPRRGQASASYRHCLWTGPTLDKPTLAWWIFFTDKRMYITVDPVARDAPS